MAKKAKAEKVEVSISDKVRAIAAKIAQAATKLAKLGDGFFGLVTEAISGGVSFEDIEAAQPALKQVGAYRSAKTTIKQAKEQGVSLVKADGTSKGKSTLKKETDEAKKAKAGSGDGEPVTPSTDGAEMTVHYATMADMLADAFKVLKGDATVRRAYAMQVQELARMVANDEAQARTDQEKANAEAATKAQAVKEQADKDAAELAALVVADAQRAQERAAAEAKTKPVSARAARRAAQQAAHAEAQRIAA